MRFPTTSWSLVQRAGGSDRTPACQKALAALCEGYWYPVYVYTRRLGFDAPEAEDLTQEFFCRLLEKHYLQDVQRERGKFRSFLLTALKHFLANAYDRANAQKRGGGSTLLPLDLEGAERRYSLEASHDSTPDKIYERRWALTLLERVLGRLRGSYQGQGRIEHFNSFKAYLTSGEEQTPYHQLAAELRMTEGAVKVAVHRLRRHYRDLLRGEIAQTVSTPAEVDEEIRFLRTAISNSV